MLAQTSTIPRIIKNLLLITNKLFYLELGNESCFDYFMQHTS